MVLPLVNLSSVQQDEYFSDGLTEDLINALAKVEGLHVVASTSSFALKGKPQDVREIGAKLNVQAVLEGTVRKAGDRLRITAQLMSAADGYHLWSATYDRQMTDLFSVQEEISQAIVNTLKIKLAGGRPARVKRYTEDPEAYQLYLKGRFYFDKRTQEGIRQSIEYYMEAIKKDPNYALAYAGLADSYVPSDVALPPRETMAKAKAAATRALELDDNLAEAHTALGRILMMYEWNWPATEKEFRRAIELNPNDPVAHHMYSHYLMAMGRVESSLSEGKQALELDPLDVLINNHRGFTYFYARQYDQAVEQYRKTREMDMSFDEPRAGLGLSYTELGQYEKAVAQFQERTTVPGGGRFRGLLAHTYAVWGKRDEAMKILNEMKESSRQRKASPYTIAIICAGLGEKDQALEWLQKAYEERSGQLLLLKVEPAFDNLRFDPKFQDLIRRMGLPE